MITADYVRSKMVDQIKVDRMCSIAEKKVLEASSSGLSSVLVEFHSGLYDLSEFNKFIGILVSKGFTYTVNTDGSIYDGYHSVRVRW